MSSIDAYCTRPAAVLKVTGEDHIDFLQSQGTADLGKSSGACHYSLWLDHKGLIHGDAFVLRVTEDKALLVSYDTPASELIAKFEKHIIADDVTITDHSAEWELLSILPSPKSDFLKERSFGIQKNRFYIEADGYLFEGHRLGRGSVEYLIPKTTSLPFEINELTEEEAESLRIHAGVPAIPGDIPPGTLNPVEAGILSAVSFTKGCYLGQEVVARVHRLQRTSTRLVHFRGKDLNGPCPVSLSLEGKVVGQITSVAEISDTEAIGIGSLKSRIGEGEQQFDDVNLTVLSLPES